MYLVQSSAKMFRLSEQSDTKSIIAYARCARHHKLNSRYQVL